MCIVFLGEPGDMRHQYCVGKAAEGMIGGQRFIGIDVEPGASDTVVFESVKQGCLVDDRTACRVHQICVRFHQSDLICANQADSPVALDDHDDDVVGSVEQVVFGDEVCSTFGGTLFGHILGPSNDLHTKGITDFGYFRANAAEPYDAQGFIADLRANFGLPLAFAHGAVVNSNILRQSQDQRPRQLESWRRARRGAGNRYTLLTAIVEINNPIVHLW